MRRFFFARAVLSVIELGKFLKVDYDKKPYVDGIKFYKALTDIDDSGDRHMKFLFTVHPMYGHFHSMVPLANELTMKGHEVAFATGKSFGSVVRNAGFPHFSCGFDFDGSKDILETFPDPDAALSQAMPSGERQLYGFIRELAPPMARDLIELAGAWKPNVIVRDPVEFGGYIAAEHYGIPHVSLLWAMYISPKQSCAKALIELRRRFGLPEDPALDSFDKYLIIDYLPESWAFPEWLPPRVTRRFQSTPYDGKGNTVLPEWLQSMPNRITVYATLGTTFNQSPDTFLAVIEAFRNQSFNLIITVGLSMDPSRFQPLPDNIRIERYIPQTLILSHCDAIIFHGGFNSLHSALTQGLPMVLLPMGAGDQYPTALRCSALGLGILIEESPPKPESIIAAVKTILGQTSYRTQVERLKAEIAALPLLSDAVKLMESLALGQETPMV